ncbi:hypothetical protein [Polycyclovorans algicola]|uniref:hypothetical protein n=1 Tax=Polycyclovorans algicola TaxID=616992 RepID=UPI0012686AD7|nr:hypothetical protein [Polycyclovorans algicola]
MENGSLKFGRPISRGTVQKSFRGLGAVLLGLAAMLVSACSDENDFGGLGAGGGDGTTTMDLRQVSVEGTNGSSTSPVVQTMSGANNGRFHVQWDVRSVGGGGEPTYRVKFTLVSVSGANAGQTLDILNNRNCDVGVDTGCAQGMNRLACDFDPASNGTRMRCPAGSQGQNDGGTVSNVGQFFAQAVGLPGTYRVRVQTCAGFPSVCAERDVPVVFQ